MAEPSASATPSTDRVPTKTKLAFGIGSTAETLSLYSVGAIAMLYYNQVLGLHVGLAGLAPTIAIFFDAISDPLLGSFSDRWKSKRWGRRHPFMLMAPIPIAVSFLFVFNPPEALTDTSLFIWFTFWYIALRTFMTLFHVPHLALGGELSTDYNERSVIMSYNNFFGWLGGAAMFKVNTLIFFASTAAATNGLLNKDAYPAFSVSIACVILVVLFTSAWFTRDRIPTLPQPAEDQPPFKVTDFVGDLVKAFGNRNYLFLMIAFFCLSLMLGLRSGLGMYMNIYYWELTSEAIGNLIFLGSFVGYVTGFIFAARLHNRFDKRATIWVTAAILSIAPAMPVILRMLGLFPENGTALLLPSIVVFQAIASGAGSILNISVMSAISDIADENELTHGLRQEGILYSARMFFAKLDNSLGHGIAAGCLWFIGFPNPATPGEVDADTIWWLGAIDSPISVIPGLIAAYFYSRYRIDKKKHAETQRLLAERRLAAESEAQQAKA